MFADLSSIAALGPSWIAFAMSLRSMSLMSPRHRFLRATLATSALCETGLPVY